ncbi:MAG: GAF domain-containing protein, partial [Myxococcales bacterium]
MSPTARLQELTAQLARAETPEEAARIGLESALQAFGAARGVFATRADERTLQLLAAPGYPPVIRERFSRMTLDTRMPAVEAFLTAKPVLVGSVAALRERFPPAAAPGVRDAFGGAIAAVPLFAGDEPVGAMSFSFDGDRVFPADEVELMLTFARQCAVAVERARLHVEELRAQEELKRSYETLQALVRASPLATCLLDADGVVRMCNPAWERVFGWTEAEVVGRPTPTVAVEQLERFRETVAAALAGEALRGSPIRPVRRDGRSFDAVLYASPVEIVAGQRQCLSIVVDVSETRRAERVQALQLAVTRVLAEAETVEDAVPQVLRCIGEQTQSLAGHLWLREGEELVHAGAWSEGADGLAQSAPAQRFTRGAGLPGRAWEQRCSMRAAELANEEFMTRREELLATDMQWAFAL